MSVTATVELPGGATLHYPESAVMSELPPWAHEPGPAEPIFVTNPFTLLDGACN